MIKRFLGIFSSVLILGLFVSGSSFALDIAPGFTRDETLSDQAVDLAKQHFTALKGQLEGIAASLPPDMQAAMNQAILLVEDKLTRLDKIDVYFTNEAVAGEAYSALYAFYQDKLSDIRNVSDEDLQLVVTEGAGIIPPDIISSLEALRADGKVKAATGSSGKSRVSIMTVYIKHLTVDTFELVEGTTLVIATDK